MSGTSAADVRSFTLMSAALRLRQPGFTATALRERIYGEISGHKRPRTSLLAARMEDGKLEATQLWEGTCNAEIFNDWLEQRLAPRLKPHHVVIMDNAAFHKSSKTREIIEQAGAKLLYLPPYSPDFNPIEHDFSAFKKIRQFNHSKSIDQIINMYK